jgi:hypothetical protein
MGGFATQEEAIAWVEQLKHPSPKRKIIYYDGFAKLMREPGSTSWEPYHPNSPQERAGLAESIASFAVSEQGKKLDGAWQMTQRFGIDRESANYIWLQSVDYRPGHPGAKSIRGLVRKVRNRLGRAGYGRNRRRRSA